MKKHKEKTHEVHLGVIDSLDELRDNPYFQQFVKKRFLLPFVFLAVLALIIIAYKVTSGTSMKSETAYIQAEKDLTQLQQGVQIPLGSQAGQSSAEMLLNTIQAYPDLQAKYDGILAQWLLIQGDVKQASPLAERTLARTSSDDLALFADFTRTTLLASQGDYEHALEQAKLLNIRLKEAVLQKGEKMQVFENKLFAYNLLRIAMLEKELKNTKGELEAWNAWKQYSEKESSLAASFREIAKELEVGNLTLADYIEEREKVLGNKPVRQ